MAIDWQQFGLRKNPFDTVPLVEGGDLPIDKAFVGRKSEREIIDDLFESEDRLCLIVAGNVGVGKTSLINFEKFVWKYSKSKLLFSSRREMEASEHQLNKENFLLEVIGSVIREIKLRAPELLKKPELNPTVTMIDITQSLAISGGVNILGFGGELGGSKETITPGKLPIASLEGHFANLVHFIKNNEIAGYRYSGLIVHMNNFDVVLNGEENSERRVQKFFNEIRDLIQLSDVYYIFIGPNDFYEKAIAPSQRVKSVFHELPLVIKPLSKTEIANALNERMQLFKSPDVVDLVKPYDDRLIYELYDLYDGDVRSIMRALREILNAYDNRLAKTLSVNEALLLLCREHWLMINKNANLKEAQIEVLQFIIQKNRPVTNKEIADALRKRESNVSSYYIKPLRDAGLIELKEQEGNSKYWGLTQKYTILARYNELQKNVDSIAKQRSQQMNLLES